MSSAQSLKSNNDPSRLELAATALVAFLLGLGLAWVKLEALAWILVFLDVLVIVWLSTAVRRLAGTGPESKNVRRTHWLVVATFALAAVACLAGSFVGMAFN